MVVQASSAAAKDIPAAMVIATGKPAAIRAGFSKAAPESPAARGRAATAIIWPRLGVGGCAPRPMKERPASAMIV